MIKKLIVTRFTHNSAGVPSVQTDIKVEYYFFGILIYRMVRNSA